MIIAPVIGIITKGISNGLGLAGEKYSDHKDRKTALAQQTSGESSAQNTALVHQHEQNNEGNDEYIWALDEAADLPSYEASEALNRPDVERTVSDLVHDVAALRRVDVQPNAARLPYPIIIPQRRPGSKIRGWARAYPPSLDAHGIGQETFLRFLQNFEDAFQASPWLKTLYIAGNVVGFVPGTITLAVSLAVTVATRAAIELQTRYTANAFLDQMNKDVFMPLGLYAMVIQCKDEPSKTGEVEMGMEAVNMDTAKQITKWGRPKASESDPSDVSRGTKILRPIRLASGHTNVEAMSLEIAPLIYPGLEDMIERPLINRDESFKDRLLRNKEFVGDYFDRRARAEWAGNNPHSVLTKASADVPEFRNRFADPNHPCNNGHLLSLITAGKYVAQPPPGRPKLREVGEDGKLKPKKNQKPQVKGPISLLTYPVKKVMTPSILYLTIVNLPTEEEMAQAKGTLGLEKKNLGDLLAQYRAFGRD